MGQDPQVVLFDQLEPIVILAIQIDYLVELALIRQQELVYVQIV